ncbi:MAG: flavin reductase family protein [Bacteroidetes bacterium]|nr:MAG: flavin reductase family protein [Bacteroidota bacterium]
MKTVNPKEVSTVEFHQILLGAVAPRPIAFASTIDAQGNVNLSPFSFYNAFGANPPILIFSPARRVRDNTTKHTLENVREVPEVVINAVNFSMVEQMSLASTEYDKGVNEFVKAGLTEVPSSLVKPPRVLESPVSFECKVLQIIETGTEGGAGNLIVCEVVLAHIHESVLNDKGGIDVRKIDLVARLGGDWYCRASGALFEVEKPLVKKGIGIDQIPDAIRLSNVLTGNNLGKLGNVETLPTEAELEAFKNSAEMLIIQQELQYLDVHTLAKRYLAENKVALAWKILLAIAPK